MILGAVCARGGSKGIPRKNLRMLAGKPLIAHAIECGRECADLDRVVVSTDDEEIAETARRYGAEVPFMRPASLAEDSTSKWPVFRHLVTSYEKLHGVRVEMLVDLDSGVPLRLPEDITGCIRLLEHGKADVVVTGYPADRNPYFNMVERSPAGFMQTVKQSNPPVVARQLAPPVFSLSPAVFAIRRQALWDYTHWSQAKLDLYEMPRSRAVDIDSELDFQLVEYLMQNEHANE